MVDDGVASEFSIAHMQYDICKGEVLPGFGAQVFAWPQEEKISQPHEICGGNLLGCSPVSSDGSQFL